MDPSVIDLRRVAEPTVGGFVLEVDGSAGGVPTTFLLDTGAARTTIVVGDDDLDEVSEPGGDADARESDQPVTQRRAITLGGSDLGLHDVTLVADTEPARVNLVALDAFGDRRFTLSAEAQQLILDSVEPAEVPLDDGERSDLLHVPVEWSEDIRVTALWDTGAPVTILDSGFYGRLRLRGGLTEAHVVEELDRHGVRRRAVVLDTPEVRVAGCRFTGHRAVVMDLSAYGVPMIVGATMWAQATWTFDLARRTFGVTGSR